MSKTEHTPEYLLKLNELRNQTLSDEVRSRIRADLSEYADFHTLPEAAARPVILNRAPFLSRFSAARRWYAGAAAVLVLMSLVSGTAYASESTLPGDALYPLKVGVAEQVELALAGSPESRAQVHANLAERRLEEAAKLAVEKKLDQPTSTYLEHKFSEHVDKTLAVADSLQQSGKIDESLSVRTDLEARLEAHTDILNVVADHLAMADDGKPALASTESLIHAIALRHEVVTEARVALERDREESASKSDTLALVTKATDSGIVSSEGVRVSVNAVPSTVAKHIGDAASALTEAQASLAGSEPQDARHAFRKAQEATRVSEVATILLKNKEILMQAGADSNATTTATTTPSSSKGSNEATTTPVSEKHGD